MKRPDARRGSGSDPAGSTAAAGCTTDPPSPLPAALAECSDQQLRDELKRRKDAANRARLLVRMSRHELICLHAETLLNIFGPRHEGTCTDADLRNAGTCVRCTLVEAGRHRFIDVATEFTLEVSNDPIENPDA